MMQRIKSFFMMICKLRLHDLRLRRMGITE